MNTKFVSLRKIFYGQCSLCGQIITFVSNKRPIRKKCSYCNRMINTIYGYKDQL
jgi:hypothetical protein